MPFACGIPYTYINTDKKLDFCAFFIKKRSQFVISIPMNKKPMQ